MNTAVIIYEGMADRPSSELDQRTPMEMARCPAATKLTVMGCGGQLTAFRGEDDYRPEAMCGRFCDLSADEIDRLWRGPLEALGAGVDGATSDWIFRADFVTMDGDRMIDPNVRGLSLQETESLTAAITEALPHSVIELAVVGPGRVVARAPGSQAAGIHSVPPHRFQGDTIASAWPRYRKLTWFRQWVEAAREVLASHPVNEVRLDLGENPANALWPWGGGKRLMPREKPLSDTVFASNSSMAAGLAKYLGTDMVLLADPWAREKGKPKAFRIAPLVQALHRAEHAVVLIESEQLGGRYGRPSDKVWALERLDHAFLAPLLTVLDAHKPNRVALCTSSAVSAESGRWFKSRLPFVVAGEGIEPDGVGHWDEAACEGGDFGAMDAAGLLQQLRKE